MLANAWVLQAKTQEIRRIEPLIQSRFPKLYQAHRLLFGLPYVLDQKGPAMLQYFTAATEPGVASQDQDWLQFFLAFAYLNNQDIPRALPLLNRLIESSKDPVIQILAMYLCYGQSQDEPNVQEMQRKYIVRWPKHLFERRLDRRKDELHIVLLLSFIKDAQSWLYGKDRLHEKIA
jgi:hypothetical protein